jgi:hypothetical protein
VVVGAVGGSGTRVVAEILHRLGVDLGSDLNTACDNWWFTLVGKLPRWDLHATPRRDDLMTRAFELLEQAMTVRLKPTRSDRKVVAEVIERCQAVSRRAPLPDDRTREWMHDRGQTLLESRRLGPQDAFMWGWKEPNSQLFIRQLHAVFGDRLRYIHVVRDGLYMARSKNQHQIRRWGPAFGIHVEGGSPSPQESLEYWIRSNEWAISQGEALPAGQFLVVNYDELCATPRQTVRQMVAFLGLDPSEPTMEELASLPHPRPHVGPARDAVEEFGEGQVDRVRALGFPVAGSDAR